MESSKHANSGGNFVESVLKARVAQLCESVGYNAITQDSSNILIDIYRRTFHHLARHCKDSANNNRRIEPCLIDLIQAYDFVGISIQDLQEYIETVKIPFNFNIPKDEESEKPANRIQRNLLVDDLLEAEKNSQLEDQVDDGENKAMSENGIDGEDEKPAVPLLKDTYEEIANKFNDITPTAADKKIRLGGRIVVLANTKLKISTPILPEPVPSTSGVNIKPTKERKKKKRGLEKKQVNDSITPQLSSKPLKQPKGKKKKKLSREFVPLDQDSDKEIEKDKIKVKIKEEKKISIKDESTLQKTKTGKRPYNKKPKVAIKPLDLDVSKQPPPFFPMEEDAQQTPISVKLEKHTPSPKLPKETKNKRKDKTSDEFKNELVPSNDNEPKETKTKSGRGRKKIKINAITPLDPSIAEPPSFFPILENKIEDLSSDILETATVAPTTSAPRLPTPTVPTKQVKSGKKKKKSNNQFAIVTETVTDADKDEKEWFCPACGSPDDGDWVQCDLCEEWYHLICTGLKKAPEDDERWECVKCTNKSKPQKKSQPQVETLKLKTPEPVVKTPPPPTTPQPPPATVVAPVAESGSGTNQDDLCPECNLPDDGTMMIQCDDPFCAKWFHGKCVNLLEEPKEDESWFCKVCVDKQQSAFKRRRRAK